MSNQNENLPQPEKISGDDYQIMIKIARYVEKHEPLNEYFDPVRTQQAFEKERHTWSFPEVLNYQRTFSEAVAIQKEAFSEIFRIIEELLTENPDRDIKVLDKAFVEMSKLYGFNIELNNTYIRFRNYYIESRDFMKRLERQFPNKLDLVEHLTRVRPKNEDQFTIKRGPFAFEIRVSQEFLNNFDDRKPKESTFQKIKERIIPRTSLSGFSNTVHDFENDTTANFILYPLDEPVVNFFRRLNDFLRDRNNMKQLKEIGLPTRRLKYSAESTRDHENKHALYNLILSSERAINKNEVIKQIEDILKNEDVNAVKEVDFSNFCFFLVENAFFANAAHEFIARLEDGNFISSVPTINNPDVYNYINPFIVGIDLLDNLYIEEILKDLTVRSIKAEQFKRIYDSYAEQAKTYIFKVSIKIGKFLEKHPEKSRVLSNLLMFKKFENWEDEIKKYL